MADHLIITLKTVLVLKNTITNESVSISESEAFDNSVAIRACFGSEERSSHRHEDSITTLYSEGNTAPSVANTYSVPSAGTDPISDLNAVDGTYIDNYQFFTKAPYHGANTKGTCDSVATQLILSYHNYFTDRRLIEGSDLLFADTDEEERNPNTCTDP